MVSGVNEREESGKCDKQRGKLHEVGYLYGC